MSVSPAPDVCNAIVKVGPKRYICQKPTGHARRGDPQHVEATVTLTGLETYAWTDSPMGGESIREM